MRVPKEAHDLPEPAMEHDVVADHYVIKPGVGHPVEQPPGASMQSRRHPSGTSTGQT